MAGLTGGGAGSQGLEGQSRKSREALRDLKQRSNRSGLCFTETVLAAVGRLDGWEPGEEPGAQLVCCQSPGRAEAARTSGRRGRGSHAHWARLCKQGQEDQGVPRMSWRWEAEMVEGKIRIFAWRFDLSGAG